MDSEELSSTLVDKQRSHSVLTWTFDFTLLSGHDHHRLHYTQVVSLSAPKTE